MPIESPQLDDLRYERVEEELRLRIPVHTDEWTDHNDSDPGITLIQLFAYLTELTGYRLNQIPEKNHIELLKLLGVRLNPAQAASTQLAFLLADPKTISSFTLSKGGRVTATVGDPPPTFETDADFDIVPAEPVVLITTESEKLWDVGQLVAGESPPADPNNNRFLTVAWDGKKPKLKDMPLGPVALFPNEDQTRLWIGINLNAGLNAGFLGARVGLAIQLDDDEQPDLAAPQQCEPMRWVGESQASIDWLHYFDAVEQQMRPVPGRIDDTTEHLTRSGLLNFTIPMQLGPIPESMYQDIKAAVTPPTDQGCFKLGSNFSAQVSAITDASDMISLSGLQTTLVDTVQEIQAEVQAAAPAEPHPMDPKFRDPSKVGAWLRLDLPSPLPANWSSPKLRIVTFNSSPATHASTTTNELLGTTSGRPGQQFQLANGNVLSEVKLAIQENVNGAMVPWKQTDSFDGKDPFARIFTLDAEAGTIFFGDGIEGRIPPLVPGGGNIVALEYRHGGGRAGEVDVATITSLETPYAGLSAAVNFVAARGGRDAETLDEAKERARKELSTRHRAVTAGDFEFIAKQTRGVRVARVEVVPLRRPLDPAGAVTPLSEVLCGADLPQPQGAAGLDDGIVAYGAVSLVVVPDLPDSDDPEPIPTPSFLQTVCRHVDQHRLVTTEIHVVPPQYMRLCNIHVTVRAEAGYTRSQLHTLVETKLGNFLHVIKGGEQGEGYPFGAQLHVSDLLALVSRIEGVDRVEDLTAEFTRTKTNAALRQGKLVLCPTAAGAMNGEVNEVQLAPEENVSVDITTLTLTTVA